jgi:hypothetical protein
MAGQVGQFIAKMVVAGGQVRVLICWLGVSEQSHAQLSLFGFHWAPFVLARAEPLSWSSPFNKRSSHSETSIPGGPKEAEDHHAHNSIALRMHVLGCDFFSNVCPVVCRVQI